MANDEKLVYEFFASHPVDAVQVLETQRIQDIVSFLNESSLPICTQIFKVMDHYLIIRCMELVNDKRIIEILDTLSNELIASILRKLPDEKKTLLVNQLKKEKQKVISTLTHFPEESAGAIMNAMALTLMDNLNVGQAVKKIKQHPENLIHYAYVLNREQKLVGYMSVRRLLMFHNDDKLLDVMKPPLGLLSPFMGFHAILENPHWSTLHALPVVDDQGLFLGVISYKKIRQSLDKKTLTQHPHSNDVGSALGELYWIGLSSIAKSLFSVFRSERDQ